MRRPDWHRMLAQMSSAEVTDFVALMEIKAAERKTHREQPTDDED